MIPSGQALAGFDPRTIPGLTLWMDAADSNTVDFLTAGRVWRWKDKSSNGYTFSNILTSLSPAYTQTQNGRPVVTFTANSATDPSGTYLINYIDFQTFSLHSHAIFLVHKPDRTNGSNVGDNNAFAAVSNTTVFRFPVGTTSGTQYSNAVTGVQTPWNDVSGVYNISVANVSQNGVSVCLNGVQQTNPGLGGITPATTMTSNRAALGAYPNASGGESNFYSGSIAELLIYNTGLSPSDQRSVEGYLAWKWGLQSNFSATYPYASNSVWGRPFLPTDIPDCILWFDAADQTTLTLAGSQVTSWQSKGILPLTATHTTAAPLIQTPGTASSGFTFTTSPLNTIQFPATTYLAVSNVVTTTPSRTLFYIFTVTSFGDGNSGLLSSSTFASNRQVSSNGWNLPNDVLAMYPYAYSVSESLTAVNVAPYSGTLGYSGTPFVIGLRHVANSASNTSTLSNAISINGSNVTPTTARKLSFGYFVGTDTFILGTGPGMSNVQRIGEVVQYDRALTDTEMRRMEGYLLSKWRVTSADSGHPYVRVPPTLPAFFSPALLQGCVFWVDAADTNTITATGSTVTSWRDKSGSGNTLTFPSGPTTGTTRINGNNVLVFAGTRGSNLNLKVDTANHTLIAVHAPTTVTSNNNLFRFQNGTASPYVVFPLFSGGSRGYVTSADGTALSNTGAGLVEGSTIGFLSMVTAAVMSTSLEVFKNGTLVGSNTSSLTSGDTSGLIFGGSTTASTYGGSVAEALVFNGKLPRQQRQLVEGYLATKWGIGLASNHPYVSMRTPAPTDGGVVIRRGLIQWSSPNTYTRASGTAWTAYLGNTWTVDTCGAQADIATTAGGWNAFDLSGTSAWYQLQDQISLPAPDSFTVDLWFRWSNGITSNARIWREADTVTGAGGLTYGTIDLMYTTSPTKTWLRFVPGLENTMDASGTALVADSWYHVALVCVAGGINQTATAYLNGAQIATSNFAFLSRPGAQYEYYTLGNTSNFRGQLGEYKLYNVALTANEVKQNYNALAPYYGRSVIA